MTTRRSLIALAVAASLLGPVLAIAQAAAPAAPASTPPVTQQAGFYRFDVGGVQVVALSDGTVPQDLHALLHLKPAHTDQLLQRGFLANPVEASINAYLVHAGDRLALVDTGAGAFFGPGAGGKLVASLKAVGVAPGQIQDVLITHIHTDHSGGLVDAQGERVFPNATIHVGKPDLDFFLAPANQQGVKGYDKAYFQQGTTALGPYVKAGQVRPFTGAVEIVPGIRSRPTPGHTPGHAFFVLQGQGGEALEFIGDILHVQAVQMPRPGVTIAYDVVPKGAKAQRLQQFARLAKERRLVAAAHLPYPGVGHLRDEGKGQYAFVPVDYRYRAGNE
jgi:glyoxylase-like metal-dependent hydrolase (beta-lactamase superfamily II)